MGNASLLFDELPRDLGLEFMQRIGVNLDTILSHNKYLVQPSIGLKRPA